MIEAFETRLREIVELKLVAGSVAFASAAESKPAALPAAYVLPLQEDPSANELGDIGVMQLVRATFGIAYAVANVADGKGRAASIDLQALRRLGMAKLLGWVPADECSPLGYGGGAVLGFKNGVLWWQDIFAADFVIKS